MRLSNINQKAIINHAEAVAPNECCGFIVSDHMDGLVFYFPCKKGASDPENFFEIAPEEWRWRRVPHSIKVNNILI